MLDQVAGMEKQPQVLMLGPLQKLWGLQKKQFKSICYEMGKVIKILCVHIFRIYQYFLIIVTLKSESEFERILLDDLFV